MDPNVNNKLDLDNLDEDAPLMAIIGRCCHTMDDASLDKHLADLRVLQTSAPTRRSAVKKAAKPKKGHKDVSHLFK